MFSVDEEQAAQWQKGKEARGDWYVQCCAKALHSWCTVHRLQVAHDGQGTWRRWRCHFR